MTMRMVSPKRFASNLLDRVFAFAGALLMAQFPQYYWQYLQRLGGHRGELRLQVAKYEQAAARLGLSLEEYIDEHLHAASEVFSSSGEVIAQVVERLLRLEAAFTALREASALTRWWVFIRHVDAQIAAQTWRDFAPGAPTSVEGLLYAGAGLLLGWGSYALLRALVQKLTRRA